MAVRLVVRAVGGKRGADVVDSMREVMRVHDTHRGDDEQVGTLVGQAMVVEANRLKGLVRKAAQLMGDREDLTGNAAICKELRGLQSECEPRNEEAIRTQMLVLNRRLELIGVVKCGSVAEVSRVRDSDGKIFALKTVNPESKKLFEEDLRIFDGRFFSYLKGILDTLSRFLSSDTVMEIKASVDNIFASVANAEFRKHLMDEFDLHTEKKNLDDARMALQGNEVVAAPVYERALVEIAVPMTYEVSADGTVLLTQWVEGPNMTDYFGSLSTPPAAQVQRELLYKLARYYFNDLLVRRRQHMDLHPGNMIIQSQSGSSNTLRVFLLDMGDELNPTEEQAQHMGQLLRFLHFEDRSDLEECERLLRGLGVNSSKPGREQFSYFSNSLDLIGGMEGLNWQENAKHTQFVTMPELVSLWTKSTSAFVMTLQTVRRKFPELQSRSSVQELVRAALSEVLHVSGYDRPSQRLAQRERMASRSRSPRSSRSSRSSRS